MKKRTNSTRVRYCLSSPARLALREWWPCVTPEKWQTPLDAGELNATALWATGERETVRRQLKVAFMTMMKEAGYVDDEGRDGGFGSEEGGQQGDTSFHSCGFYNSRKSSSRQARRRWRETLNAAHVTPVWQALGSCSLSHRRIQHKDPFKYSIALPAIYSLLLLGPNAPSAISAAFSLATIPNSSKISSVCSPVGRDSERPDNSATFHGYVLDRLGWGSGISSDDSSAASEGDKTGTAHESVSLFRKSVTRTGQYAVSMIGRLL